MIEPWRRKWAQLEIARHCAVRGVGHGGMSINEGGPEGRPLLLGCACGWVAWTDPDSDYVMLWLTVRCAKALHGMGA